MKTKEIVFQKMWSFRSTDFEVGCRALALAPNSGARQHRRQRLFDFLARASAGADVCSTSAKALVGSQVLWEMME